MQSVTHGCMARAPSLRLVAAVGGGGVDGL